MLATWFGFYADWEVSEKVTFDGPNRLIIVNPGVTSIDIQTDVYSAWKRWMVASGDNSRFEAAIRTIGGDPTTGSQKAGDIYFLINSWRLEIDFNQTSVTGVLFSDDFETAYYSYDLTPLFPAVISSTVNAVTTVETVVNEAALAPLATQVTVDELLADVAIVNQGVKKASILIPHTDDV